MDQRQLAVDEPHLADIGDTDAYLAAALDDIVANYPPRSRYAHETLQGLWSGPTGVAHLLLQASARRPDLTVNGHPADALARAYLAPGSRGRRAARRGGPRGS